MRLFLIGTVANSVLFKKDKNTLLRRKCTVNVKIYAGARWEMCLKALGDQLSST
jgi:hypothetical protein